MRFCKVENNVITNIINAEQSFIDTLPETYIENETASVGWIYDSTTTNFTNPNIITLIEPPFEELQSNKINSLHKTYDDFFNAYKSAYPEGEQSSFDDKRKEALAYFADNTALTPVCDSISTARGEDRVEFLQSVYDATLYLTTQEGEMIKVRDSIKACTTEDELDAVVIPGFPVVS